MITKPYLLIVILLAGAEALFAQQSDFNRATDLLEQQEYRQAIQEYQQIAEEGHESGALWFNLGIAYSQIDSLGMAKYYFLKSAQYPETTSEASGAIEAVNNRFSRRSAVLPPLPWERFFTHLDEEIGAETLHIAGFILLYIALIALLGSWYLKPEKSFLRYIIIAGAILSIIFFSSAFYITYLDTRYDTGVVVDRETRVYQSPNTESAEISTAYEGYTVRVDNRESAGIDEWFYIRLENGMNGWILKSSIQTLS